MPAKRSGAPGTSVHPAVLIARAAVFLGVVAITRLYIDDSRRWVYFVLALFISYVATLPLHFAIERRRQAAVVAQE